MTCEGSGGLASARVQLPAGLSLACRQLSGPGDTGGVDGGTGAARPHRHRMGRWLRARSSSRNSLTNIS